MISPMCNPKGNKEGGKNSKALSGTLRVGEDSKSELTDTKNPVSGIRMLKLK